MELSGAERIRISPATKELPEDLIRTQILARLPIKSLARFKSVCKSWFSLLSSDPQFVKELCSQNPNDCDCIVANFVTHIVIISRYKEIFSHRGYQLFTLIGSANGLVCVLGDRSMSLWNPIIYQSKECAVLPPQYCLVDKFGWHVDKIGFGFDPVSNDYKVVVCYQSFSSFNLNCVVYSSNSDTWIHKQQHIPGYEILVSKFEKQLRPTTMVRYCPYWTCSTKDENKASLAALKFDTTSNEFKLLAEFCYDVSSEPETTFKFVSMKDLFALMTYKPSDPTNKLDLYFLDEEKGSGGLWNKMHSFEPIEQFWSFKHMQLQQVCKFGDKIVFHDYSKMYRYDHKTNTSERIPSPTISSAFWDCFSYTPSLICLPGMMSIYLENQTTALGHQSKTRGVHQTAQIEKIVRTASHRTAKRGFSFSWCGCGLKF